MSNRSHRPFRAGDPVWIRTTETSWRAGVVAAVSSGKGKVVHVREADGVIQSHPRVGSLMHMFETRDGRVWDRPEDGDPIATDPVPATYKTWDKIKDPPARVPHIVVSLKPGGVFAVDHLSGDPAETLERWRRLGSRRDRIPVAAFPLENVPAFCKAAGVAKVPGEYVLDECHANWIRRAPLAFSWRRAVIAHVARFEGAARVLAQLTAA